MEENILRAKDLLKTEGIIHSSPDDTLSQALVKISRSHDAIFVLDDKEKFLGIINPYYAIFKSNFPSETKLKHCLFSPPKLSLDDYIWDIAKLMTESKIYFLPVTDQENHLKGIVTVNRLLRAIQQKTDFINKINLEMKKEIISVSSKTTVDQAFNLMRDKQVSRLPVVNDSNHLIGIVTRYDLREAFSKPQDSPRFFSRQGNRRKYLDKPLEKYYKKMVFTADAATPASEVLKIIIENNIGSVVIINKKRSPIGIISIYDILRSIEKIRPQKEMEIEVTIADDFKQKAQLEIILSSFFKKINKLNPIRRLEFVLGTERNPAGKTSGYITKIYLSLKNGKMAVAKFADHDWRTALNKAKNKIKRQIAREK